MLHPTQDEQHEVAQALDGYVVPVKSPSGKSVALIGRVRDSFVMRNFAETIKLPASIVNSKLLLSLWMPFRRNSVSRVEDGQAEQDLLVGLGDD